MKYSVDLKAQSTYPANISSTEIFLEVCRLLIAEVRRNRKYTPRTVFTGAKLRFVNKVISITICYNVCVM